MKRLNKWSLKRLSEGRYKKVRRETVLTNIKKLLWGSRKETIVAGKDQDLYDWKSGCMAFEYFCNEDLNDTEHSYFPYVAVYLFLLNFLCLLPSALNSCGINRCYKLVVQGNIQVQCWQSELRM
jgi:hypothetical protein